MTTDGQPERPEFESQQTERILRRISEAILVSADTTRKVEEGAAFAVRQDFIEGEIAPASQVDVSPDPLPPMVLDGLQEIQTSPPSSPGVQVASPDPVPELATEEFAADAGPQQPIPAGFGGNLFSHAAAANTPEGSVNFFPDEVGENLAPPAAPDAAIPTSFIVPGDRDDAGDVQPDQPVQADAVDPGLGIRRDLDQNLQADGAADVVQQVPAPDRVDEAQPLPAEQPADPGMHEPGPQDAPDAVPQDVHDEPRKLPADLAGRGIDLPADLPAPDQPQIGLDAAAQQLPDDRPFDPDLLNPKPDDQPVAQELGFQDQNDDEGAKDLVDDVKQPDAPVPAPPKPPANVPPRDEGEFDQFTFDGLESSITGKGPRAPRHIPPADMPEHPMQVGEQTTLFHEDDSTILQMVQQYREADQQFRKGLMDVFERIIMDLHADNARLMNIVRHFQQSRRSMR